MSTSAASPPPGVMLLRYSPLQSRGTAPAVVGDHLSAVGDGLRTGTLRHPKHNASVVAQATQ
ncbi:MAG: hypothetical protein ACFCVB_02820 [Nodosilinea sp.]